MSTLNLDLPVSEKIVTRWNSLTAEERQQWEASLAYTLNSLNSGENLPRIMGAKFDSDDSEDWEYDETERAEVRAAVEEAIAEDEAGLSIPFEQFWEEARARWAKRGIHF